MVAWVTLDEKKKGGKKDRKTDWLTKRKRKTTFPEPIQTKKREKKKQR